jgi:Tfp pilus assembly PilM family ATPase
MNGIKRCAGINITTSKFQFVEVEKESNQLLINHLGQTFITPSIKFEEQSETELPAQLQTAFDEINIQNPINSKVVSFTLPPELFITMQLPYDNNLIQAEVTEEFRWEISQLFPFLASEELAIKYYDLGKDILPGNNNALVVALNKKYLLILKNFCTKNNLNPRLVDNASITANGFINSYSSVQDSISVNIYNSKSSITLFINISSKPAYVKVFQKTRIDFLDSIIKILSVDRIKNLLIKSTKYAFFSGDDIGNDLQSEFQLKTGLESIKFNPFNIVQFKPDAKNTGISGEQYSTFTAATGIAARFN